MVPLEIWIVASILVLFFAVSLLSCFSGAIILAAGVTLIAIGLILGVPIGFYYHLLLFQRKKLLGLELKGWWISPRRYHEYLPEKERRILNRWFWIGAVFFNIAMIGCGLVFIWLFMGR
ncbi:MAG: hypothetical protein AAB275_05470 [Deltaproteobacteria bacterium]